MYLLSNKGLPLVFLGLGLVLGLLGSSKADVRCYQCDGTPEDSTTCNNGPVDQWEVENCTESACVSVIRIRGERATPYVVEERTCNEEQSYGNEDGCKSFENGKKMACVCHDDLCNKETAKALGYGPPPGGDSNTGTGETPGTDGTSGNGGTSGAGQSGPSLSMTTTAFLVLGTSRMLVGHGFSK